MADGAPSSAKSSVDILTLGCRLNSYESEVMRGHAEAAGLQDAVIVNTCAVTAEAVRQARQTIRRARRERPTASIIVTGCAAQIDPASFAEMPEVSRVIGNAEKMKAETFKPIDFVGEVERVQVNDIMTVREVAAHLVDGLDGRARAFVQVQTGCDHRCTFCIIPYGRGNSRSVPAGEVIDQVKRLVATGHYEIVLTGVDLTSWGADLPNAPKLGNLVTRILKLVPDLKQLRLSSIDAIEIDEPLFEALAHEPRIAPHLHLSFQSGDDMILKRMKRRHSRADAISLCNRLREARPEMAFGADLIAGFPTETDEMFANTLASVDECGIDYLHVFPYSPRPGTPAAKMPQVARDIVKARAATLREKGAARLNLRLNRHVGLTAMALVEAGNRARLPDFAPVRIDGASPEPGRPALFNLVSRSATELVGQLA
ncbi:MAG TPA: tRNA (N(6)-L-threonylcarbamoyladenosine(37)-C(2))-methylthiotransferase MtaB [Hyphomonadaceae bacterium]|nr:tRNA (N(6)-L-threonylcarbamoyladenosine(37)-C(2))-methylthiotransferase MtaB [Hyphomonadaceae bacterium]HPI47837.1 tRNA (N(6)-L-threonylcarbamoyladenosine(37)-C(2))-methylthiotransferase MtaB [Hyphomonadaceae bacterium]